MYFKSTTTALMAALLSLQAQTSIASHTSAKDAIEGMVGAIEGGIHVLGELAVEPELNGSGTGEIWTRKIRVEGRDGIDVPGVSQESYDQCTDSTVGVTITATKLGPGSVQFDNVPAPCMDLATVLIGNPVTGPWPIPCGSACLVYNNLTDDQYNELVAALQAKSSSRA